MTVTKAPQIFSSPEAVSSLLSGLLGRAVGAKRAPTPISVMLPAFVAAYQRDDSTPVGLCICDLSLAANLAACLSLIPPAQAVDAVRARKLPQSLDENFHEVLNICTQFFQAEHRITLGKVSALPGNLPKDILAIMLHPAAAIELEISVPSYMGGRMSLRSTVAL